MARYNDYVFDYSLAIPGEDEAYPYSHSQTQSRLHPANTHLPVREAQRSLARYVPHTIITPQYVSRPGQIEYSNISPVDTRCSNHYSQQYPPHCQTSPHQTVDRSPAQYEDHLFDGPYYSQPSNSTVSDSSDESSSSQLSRSYERIRHRNVPHTKSLSQRFYCEFQDCIDKDTGKRRSLGRKADLKRHILTVHGEPKYDCPMPRCGRKGSEGFCRTDHRNEHLRTYHNKEVVTAKSRKNQDD